MPRHRSGKADQATAQRIRAARAARTLTQAQVAKELQVSLETYVNWEAGFSEPRISQFRTLAGLLKTTPNHLLGV